MRSWPRSSGRGPAGWPTSSPRSRPSRTSSSGPRSRASSSSPAGPAPGRRRSRCTGPPTCSTPTASASRTPGCWWSGRTGRSCATSSTCCPRSARAASSSPRSTRSTAGCGRPRRTTPRPSGSRATAAWSRLLAKAVSDRERPLADDLVVPYGSTTLRLSRGELRRIIEQVRHRRGTHNARRPVVVRRHPAGAVGRVPPGARAALRATGRAGHRSRAVRRRPGAVGGRRRPTGRDGARDAGAGGGAVLRHDRQRPGAAHRARAHVAGADRRGAAARPVRSSGPAAPGRRGHPRRRRAPPPGATTLRQRRRRGVDERGPRPARRGRDAARPGTGPGPAPPGGQAAGERPLDDRGDDRRHRAADRRARRRDAPHAAATPHRARGGAARRRGRRRRARPSTATSSWTRRRTAARCSGACSPGAAPPAR